MHRRPVPRAWSRWQETRTPTRDGDQRNTDREDWPVLSPAPDQVIQISLDSQTSILVCFRI